jgi:hypothetical protein
MHAREIERFVFPAHIFPSSDSFVLLRGYILRNTHGPRTEKWKKGSFFVSCLLGQSSIYKPLLLSLHLHTSSLKGKQINGHAAMLFDADCSAPPDFFGWYPMRCFSTSTFLFFLYIVISFLHSGPILDCYHTHLWGVATNGSMDIIFDCRIDAVSNLKIRPQIRKYVSYFHRCEERSLQELVECFSFSVPRKVCEVFVILVMHVFIFIKYNFLK